MQKMQKLAKVGRHPRPQTLDPRPTENPMSPSNFIAIPDADAATSGIITYWTMVGGDCPHDELVEELQVRNIPEGDMPSLPSDTVAFYRAVHTFEGPTRFMRVHKSSKAPAAYLVDESQEGDQLELHTRLRLQLTGGTPIAAGDDPEDIASQVKVEFRRQQGRLTASDVSTWLVKRVTAADAVSLRPSGGMYFVPNHGVEKWRSITGAVHAATTYRVFEIPAMQSDQAIEAILASVLREAEQESEAISADIKRGDLGARALRSRSSRCEHMAAKVSRYESLLGTSIHNYRTIFEQLEAASTRAALVAAEVARA